MAWKEPHPEIKNPKGFLENWYNLTNDYTNWYSKAMYDVTGYDPSGRGAQYDYYGKNINRDIATKLGTAKTAQYDAATKKLANQFAVARTRTNQSAQARGLQKSGFAAEQERQLTGQQAQAEGEIYASLLNEEQTFLDDMYKYNKAVALKVALNERAEAFARQTAFQDFLVEMIPTWSDIAEVGKLATSIAPII